MEKIRELIGKRKKTPSQNSITTPTVNSPENPAKSSKENSVDPALRRRIRTQIAALVSSFALVVVLIFAMSAAWFTNVAKTSDLILETESWGFDADKITLSETAISIAPGTSGIVPMTVDNSSGTESVCIGVSVSKVNMEPEELKKRIYFYADTPKTITYEGEQTGEENSVSTVTETTSRVYLGAAAPDYYTYTLLPGQIMTMNETFYSHVPIRWEWVYDMLGYYFRGIVDTEAESPVVAEEYLRPVEYDYYKATFDTEEESDSYHQLVEIDGITVSEFLEDISGADGYAGTVDAEQAVPVTRTVVDAASGEEVQVTCLYYPVEVDEDGYGIWAYLCNYDEVEAGIAYDTALSKQVESGEGITAEATIVFTAYNVPTQTESVNTEAALNAALTDDSVDVVQLSADITTGSTIAFTEGTKVLDLNGYTMEYHGTEETYALISVSDGSSLIVTNGQLSGDSTATGTGSINSKAVEVTGGNTYLSGVRVSGFDCAVSVSDYTAETPGDSTVQIVNSDLEAAQVAVVLQGNGAASDAMTRMIIQDSKIVSKYHTAISGQGNDDRWGTELVLTSSEIEGYYGGIYQPQRSSSTTISACTITGNTGVILKGGTMNIYDSTIRGTGAVAVDEAKALKSGYTDTGDGVYVEAAYEWSATVILKGANQVTSDLAYAVEMVGAENMGPGRIRIHDGTYAGYKGSANWNDFGTFEIYGGEFQNYVNETITRYDETEETEQ